ncbi:MAG TPA: glycosyltransferase family 4 protein [Vicinamibacterales bacterium]|nr:glycosyltransferase family 4 protein [Vicinamibacterales bacterium]
MKIAFIVQRYGTEILGGSEYHCRLIAERVALHHQVEVLTTCAREYTTWANEYPEGADRIRGVTVRRFATARTRNMAEFNRLSDWIFTHRHSPQDEMRWLEEQGPWAPALVDYLERHHPQYDVLVFFTYLYAPTVLGLRVAPSKSLLVPTAHDEPAIRLGLYQDVFSRPAGMVWNTDVERRFVSSMFHLRTAVEDVVGCGVDLSEGEASLEGELAAPARASHETLPPHLEGQANTFRRRHRLLEPFLLYGGRIDPGKGCEELLEYFQHYLKDGGDASLVLMGVKLMPLPDDPHVRFAGTLPDTERLHALEAASVVVVPSPYESLSLLALEAFAVGTPVLANARSEVVVDHCRRSRAGLYYADRYEFSEALRLLMKDAKLRAALGRNGKSYIHRHYRWSTILAKYERLFGRLHAPAAPERPVPHRRRR